MAEPNIVEKIRQANEGNKIINGHSPEYIARHIGDPWQRLDAKGVTIIDYEFGPVVEYRATKAQLLSKLWAEYYRAYSYHDRTWQGKHEKKDLDPGSPEAFSAANQAPVEELITKVENAQLSDYPKIAEEFQAFRQKVETETAKYNLEGGDREPTEEEANVISLWYLAIEGARLQDVYDQKTIVGPQIERFARSLPHNLTKEEKRKLIWQKNRELVEKIRLKKTTKEADVAQTIFPELPFADESFNRIVAYFSVTTYAFQALDFDDFMLYWSEINRVLKNGGRAYLGPLYNTDSGYNESIKVFQETHPNVYFYEEDMPDIPPVKDRLMLVIGKVVDSPIDSLLLL